MSKVYFPNLNGLRFIAALSVIIYHFYGEEVLNGHYGVTLFFTLSGFLITYLLFEEKEKKEKISIGKFYVRRILRIWPLYFFILLISSIVFFYDHSNHHEYYNALPYYLLFTPNLAFILDIGIKYSSILWSVGAEEQFYLTWPWIIQKVKNKRLAYLLGFIVLSWAIGPHILDYVNYNYLSSSNSIFVLSKLMGRMGFGAMATGSLIAYLAKFKPDKLSIIFSPIVQVIAILSVLTIWIFDMLPHVAASDQIYASLFAVIIANFALNDKCIISLENKPLNYLGKISFGLYVYHLIMFDVSKQIFIFLNIDVPQIVLFTSGTLTTVIVAGLSYQYFERPFLKLKSKKYTTIQSGNEILPNK